MSVAAYFAAGEEMPRLLLSYHENLLPFEQIESRWLPESLSNAGKFLREIRALVGSPNRSSASEALRIYTGEATAFSLMGVW